MEMAAMDIVESPEEKMLQSEVDPNDERRSLLRNICRNAGFYKTKRSSWVRSGLVKGNWVFKERNPIHDRKGRSPNFIFECCALSINLQHEIIAKYYVPVRHHFHRFFPELAPLAADPTDYLRVVKMLTAGMGAKNATFPKGLLLDLQREGLLPPHAAASVRSSLSACPMFLSQKTLLSMRNAFARSFRLDSISKELDAFVHRPGRFGLLAPNLSALVGPSVAAKLVGAAGSLSKLSGTPIPHIALLSPTNCRPYESLATFPKLFDYPEHEQELQRLPQDITRCYVAQTDLIRSTPQPRLRIKACHCLSERIHLAAEADLYRTDLTGETGRALGEEIRAMVEKWKDEDSALLTKPGTELTERPKKDVLAVPTDYCKMFKPKLSKKKLRDMARIKMERIKRDNIRAKRRSSSLKKLRPPTATTTATATPSESNPPAL